eukprot:762790-Hanusia_phi.AAC.11
MVSHGDNVQVAAASGGSERRRRRLVQRGHGDSQLEQPQGAGRVCQVRGPSLQVVSLHLKRTQDLQWRLDPGGEVEDVESGSMQGMACSGSELPRLLAQ